MAESAAPRISSAAKVLVWALAVSLVAFLAALWLAMSTAGARVALNMLDHYTGIYCSGVSGSLTDNLHIAHIGMRTARLELNADEVEVQWRPRMLLQRQLQVDQLHIGSLALAMPAGDGQPATLPNTLALPTSIRGLNVKQLSVQQFQLARLEADHSHSHLQHFSALLAEMRSDSSSYTIKFSGSTPWGKGAMEGKLGASAPFNIAAQLHWQGLALKQDNVTLPETRLDGTLSGTLSRLQILAQLQSGATGAGPSQSMVGGSLQLVATPFAVLPAEFIQIDFSGVNPASFYENAPKARLKVKADFHLSGAAAAPVLSGHFLALNDLPAAWNQGGMPLLQISSDLTVTEKNIRWTGTRIGLEQNGNMTGEGEWMFPDQPTAATKTDSSLPKLNTRFDLNNVNLLSIDSRLKKTRLSGRIKVENKNQALDMSLKLQQAGPDLTAQLAAALALDKDLTLNLQRLEIQSRDATLNAQGSLALRNNQEFALEGEAHQFNPARWINVPDGRLAARFKLQGQLQHGWRVDAQLADLSGQFAGLDLHGVADFQARQEGALSVQKLDLVWGKNHLSARGGLQLDRLAHPDSHQQLEWNLAVPDLEMFTRPFTQILPVSMHGSVFADGVISGSTAQPAGHFTLRANQLVVPGVISLDRMQADLSVPDGAQGELAGKLDLTGLAMIDNRSAVSKSDNKSANPDDRLKIIQMQAGLTGVRHNHILQLTATLPQQQQLVLQAQGDLRAPQSGSESAAQWVGRITSLNLNGPLDFQLQSPFNLQLSANAAHVDAASWQGKLGRLHVDQLDWSYGQFTSSGQFQDIPVVRVMKFARITAPITGNLLLAATWQFNIGQQSSGQLQIQRSSGDLTLLDHAGGHAQTIPLGIQKLSLITRLVNADPFQRSQIAVKLSAQGEQLGLIEADLSTYLKSKDQDWELARDAPLSGRATMQIKDIRWMSQLTGSGIALGGELDATSQIGGTLDKPEYQAKIAGHDLQISLIEPGILLPNGVLDAVIEDNQLRLNSLKFSQAIKRPPRHDHLSELTWLDETGVIESSGVVNIHTGKGSITTHWQKFPFMQSAAGWLVASGQADIAESENTWNLTGQLVADAAYFSVPKQAAPKLSSDVVVLKKNDLRSLEKSSGLQTSLDFNISTGKNFIFVGRGLDTRLDGEIRIRSKNGGPLTGSGTIQTDGGTYEGYGQKLAIDRGILNFQGPIDNPGLNVRAIRRGLPVEAGVEVIGTVGRPEVHLISEPNVPDPDKLSWMVLGRASDQMAGSEAALLMSAAGAIFGGGNGSNMPSTIANSFGLDGISFGTASASPESQLPAQTVAGTINSSATGDQVFSIGKRIAPNLVFSIERSLADASNGLKLTWQLTRQFSINGRAGSDTAIDGQYTFSFD